MADWAIVATVKAPEEQVLAFVAHHLALGCAQIALFFDDPDDPVAEVASRLPRVEVTRCDAAHWARLGARPERHQNRQARNALRSYRRCRQPWMAHIDVDEFLWPEVAPSELLDTIHRHQLLVRAEPFEALHDPDLPDDIFTARQFRGPMKAPHAALRCEILGPLATVLTEGVLSHSVGKAFFRTGIPRLVPGIHGGAIAGERIPGLPFDPRMKLLHFHAQDRTRWLAALPFRLERGAYRYRPGLHAHLSAASQAEITAFYDATQRVTPEQARRLAGAGRLVEADLGLNARVAALRVEG
ncbi:MAG: glycosyltransferase family 2 protein [Rhodobacteraceae bacterium]|mgnify:CR=1 FL=1|jgi:hypothetical protein|nr:glycosyltransferase family 2 protein [Paracoccaceae bacterium]